MPNREERKNWAFSRTAPDPGSPMDPAKASLRVAIRCDEIDVVRSARLKGKKCIEEKKQKTGVFSAQFRIRDSRGASWKPFERKI